MTADLTGPASHLLLDASWTHAAASWAIIGGDATMAESIAADHAEASIRWQPVDSRERLAVTAMPNLQIAAPDVAGEPVEAVVVPVPPDRDLARRWLLLARMALAPGGSLFLAGANSEGIRSVIRDAQTLFGAASREESRAKGRLAVFTGVQGAQSSPAWASEPGVAPGTWREFTLDVDGVSLPLVIEAGVFAGDGVDAGTRLLIDALAEQVAGSVRSSVRGSVLDVGCGAGVIGIAAAQLGARSVDMVDVSLLAVQAAAENIRRLGLAQCRALAGDVYSACDGERYDLIVSNPPFHRGKIVDYTVADRLIAEASAHLRPGGSLVIVANAFLAYGQRMERVFGAVETLVANRQYHVLRGTGPR